MGWCACSPPISLPLQRLDTTSVPRGMQGAPACRCCFMLCTRCMQPHPTSAYPIPSRTPTAPPLLPLTWMSGLRVAESKYCAQRSYSSPRRVWMQAGHVKTGTNLIDAQRVSLRTSQCFRYSGTDTLILAPVPSLPRNASGTLEPIPHSRGECPPPGRSARCAAGTGPGGNGSWWQRSEARVIMVPRHLPLQGGHGA